MSALAHTAEFYYPACLEGISQPGTGKILSLTMRALSCYRGRPARGTPARGRKALEKHCRAVQEEGGLRTIKSPALWPIRLSLPLSARSAVDVCAMQSRTAGVLKRLEHLEAGGPALIRRAMEDVQAGKSPGKQERAAPREPGEPI